MLLYIDPGTGSMLFAILIGALSAGLWFLKGLIVKIRFIFSRGKIKDEQNSVIPFVIFSDDKRYWSVFEPVCKELSEREFDVTYFTASPDDPALKCEYPHFHSQFIGEDNRAFARLNMLSATMVLSTTPGLDVYQWKRSKGVKYYVHMMHAASDITGYKMFGVDYYDAVLISGEYQKNDIRSLEKLRNLPEKEIEMIGIPYMDKMAKRLKENPAVKNKTTTVLLAPSWGKSSIFGRFGGKVIDELLKTDYNIIIRPHPQSFKSEQELIGSLMQKYPDSDKIKWNRDADNFEVLKSSDIMISDFSGVIHDFALVYDKPVIYADTEFDNSPYDACWLDTPFWTFTALPRIGEKLTADDLGRLPKIIKQCLTEEKYSQGRKEIREETWACYGEGAKRAADYIINKYDELTHKEDSTLSSNIESLNSKEEM